MINKTFVLPSARAIRHEQLKLQDNEALFLPNYLSMGDFISKLTFVKDFMPLDEDSRVLLLLEATDFKNFSALKIDRNFFTFTKNSRYIFKFFEELSAELYDIKDLLNADLYAEYEEHILILIELYKRYKELCLQKKVLDKIFLPQLYNLNRSFLKSHKDIEIKIDGYLTNFELKLILEAVEFSNIILEFTITPFNKKMHLKLEKILDKEFDINFTYRVSLNSKEILEKTKLEIGKNIFSESFSEALLQVAFAKRKVYEFIQKGYKPQNIAIVLPDESMANTLRLFDGKKNLNFAMGESFTQTDIYKKLDASLKFLEQNSKENIARVQRVGFEIVDIIKPLYYRDDIDIIEILERFEEFINSKDILKIYQEEIFKFKKIQSFIKDKTIKSLLMLFTQRLAKRTIDDVFGGEITVMGVLETRSIEFDGVIILDFNDSNVPKRSDKDMFLNSKVRQTASLPTTQDRENLQKYYYYMLISRAKEVAISYVQSEDSYASKFLKELNIEVKNEYLESEYANLLFKKSMPTVLQDSDIVMDYEFKTISATKLKTYLSCKRKFYYRYVKDLKKHTIAKDMPNEWEIGSDIHEALKNLYLKKDSYFSVDELKKDLYFELDCLNIDSELEHYLIEIQKRKLEKFCVNEVKRFNDGYKVAFCEKSFQTPYNGLILNGQIDRIDKKDNKFTVIDYKTGNIPIYNKNNYQDATDFQLEFYYLLASGIGNIEDSFFYNLKDSTLILEPFFKEKLEILKAHLKDLTNIKSINFEKTENEKECEFCEFSLICNR